MKPDDILNAIGDVDEKFVRRAYRKDILKAVLTFAVTLGVLVMFTTWMLEPDYILSRINMDFTVNMGYVEPEHLKEDGWTSMEYTAYENGEMTATTVFQRRLYDHYTVTHTPVEGERTVLVGSGEASAKEYVGEKDIDTFYMETYYSEDLIGRIDSMVISSRFAHDTPYEVLNYLKMEYYEGSDVAKQTRYAGKENHQVIGWQSLSYSYGKVSKTMDYDGDGNLLAYTEYTDAGTVRWSESYTAEGVLTGTTEARYDWLGNIRERTYYDAEGSLTGRESYRYRVWELYGSPEGLFTLVAILSLSLTLGMAVYDDRIRLKKPEKKEEEQ